MAITKRHQAEVNVSIDRMWKAFLEMPELITRVIPDAIKSVDRAEGGFTTIYFAPAIAAKFGDYVKEKAEYHHKEKKLVVDLLEGGGIGTKYKSKKTIVCLKPGKGENSTIVAWDVHCDPVEDKLEETESLSTLKKIEEYLIAHPDVYA